MTTPWLPSTMTRSPPETSVRKGPSHDGGMAGPAAGLRGERMHHVRVKSRGFAGGEVVRDDDYGLLEVAQVFAALAEQVSEDGALDVVQVGGAVGQVAAIDALERLGVAAHDATDGILGGKVLFPD